MAQRTTGREKRGLRLARIHLTAPDSLHSQQLTNAGHLHNLTHNGTCTSSGFAPSRSHFKVSLPQEYVTINSRHQGRDHVPCVTHCHTPRAYTLLSCTVDMCGPRHEGRWSEASGKYHSTLSGLSVRLLLPPPSPRADRSACLNPTPPLLLFYIISPPATAFTALQTAHKHTFPKRRLESVRCTPCAPRQSLTKKLCVALASASWVSKRSPCIFFECSSLLCQPGDVSGDVYVWYFRKRPAGAPSPRDGDILGLPTDEQSSGHARSEIIRCNGAETGSLDDVG